MDILLKREWQILKKDIKISGKNIEPLSLARIILNWGKKFENYKDNKIRSNYIKYLLKFQVLDIEEYNFKKRWYDFNNLLKMEILRIDNDTDRLIIELYEILTEILIFKSNIEGPIESYYYRVYTDLKKEKIYYISDLGGEVLDINLKEIELREKVIPAPSNLIEKYNIQVCQEFDTYS